MPFPPGPRILLALLASNALPAAAMPEIDGACSKRPVQWGCIGHLDMRAPQATVRISGYENREMLVQLEQGGAPRRLLVTRQGGFVDSDSDIRAGKQPFAYFGYALAPVLMTLPLMFPDGPESVPRTPLTRTLQVESNTRATVTASRGADGAIRFRIEGERVGGPIEGSYRSGLLPPLPADFDMRGWYRAPGPGRFGEPPPGPVPAPGERLEQLR